MSIWDAFERKRGFLARHLNIEAATLSELTDAGIVTKGDLLKYLPCPECGGKCSPLSFNSTTRTQQIYCGEYAVYNDVPAESIELLEFNRNLFVQKIQRDLNLRVFTNTERVSDIFFDIGEIELSRESVRLYLARDLSHKNQIDNLLSRLPDINDGAILTQSNVPTLSGKGYGFTIIPVSEVLILKDGKFSLDRLRLSELLFPVSKGKRDSVNLLPWKEIVDELWQQRSAENTVCKTLTGEAKVLEKLLGKDQRAYKQVGHSMIRKHISTRHAAWRELNS